ncbi:MAG: Biopolymer transport protein ExbD/TolR [Myxococcales bacterium]|jgi:biopolymer transport protein ExbD|nr:Biopolymer transport protein ExbD/TolR [Myxococcales bacterium]
MAGTMSSGGGRSRTIAAINVTPLVDVVLVLLVILMVASTYIVAQTLKVQLPRAKSTDGTADKPTKVEILKDGKLRWNEAPVQESELPGKLAAAVAADPEVSLVVSADKEVQHGNVVHVLDLAKIAGVVKFAINVQQTE